MSNVWPKRLVYSVTTSVRTVGSPGQKRNDVGQPAPVFTSAAFRRTTFGRVRCGGARERPPRRAVGEAADRPHVVRRVDVGAREHAHALHGPRAVQAAGRDRAAVLAPRLVRRLGGADAAAGPGVVGGGRRIRARLTPVGRGGDCGACRRRERGEGGGGDDERGDETHPILSLVWDGHEMSRSPHYWGGPTCAHPPMDGSSATPHMRGFPVARKVVSSRCREARMGA